MIGEDDGFGLACDSCLSHPPVWDQGRAALVYEGTARRLILALKHGDRTDIARPASQWLAQAAAPFLQYDPIVTPVPLHWSRFLYRRYNQSALLAAALAKRQSLDYCPDLLSRARRTPSLEGKSRADRQAILADAIASTPRWAARISGRNILLVDDVMTSGATLSACAIAALRAGAAGVRIVVLARVTRP